MKRPLLLAVTLGALVLPAAITVAQQPDKKRPADQRYGPPKTLNGYFPFTPPKSLAAWEVRKRELREQVLVASGLWPMPEKTPLNAIIHGKIERDEYTVEKVYFASFPGHYVSGNLYRPRNKPGKVPAVLFTHGHWDNGRFHDAGEAAAKKQMQIGAEKTMESARFMLQAPAAMLARMGCVVFVYDMVGYADSQQIKHRVGFTDVEAELRLQSFMGLQTWNGVRALDFVLGLPDVDPSRVAMTGASGGGTQTFILGGIDDRLTAAFPAVMVGTGMQGGCICENCSVLRVGTGNVELAGLMAPRPLGMSGADDWTIELETKGLPQLKELYRLHDAEEMVAGKVWREFKHNYNQPAREMMYAWFNKHLKLGYPEPVAEKPFVPVPPKELSVYDPDHPLPKDASNAAGLRKSLTAASDKQLALLQPKDKASLAEFRRVWSTGLRAMVGDKLRSGVDEVFLAGTVADKPGYTIERSYLSQFSGPRGVPISLARGKDWNGTVLVWVHPKGAASLSDDIMAPLVAKAMQQKMAVLAVDVFLCGEGEKKTPPGVDKNYAGFTFGYNRSLLGNRVGDILLAVAHARGALGAKKVHLAGFGKAGPWVVLARALCGDAVQRCAADMDGFRFENITSTSNENMLPGAFKYGGMARLSALCAPGELYLHNLPAGGMGDWLGAAYVAAGAKGQLELAPGRAPSAKVLEWLTR